jgi:hypothetical protein
MVLEEKDLDALPKSGAFLHGLGFNLPYIIFSDPYVSSHLSDRSFRRTALAGRIIVKAAVDIE